jgi:hypothetical protein
MPRYVESRDRQQVTLLTMKLHRQRNPWTEEVKAARQMLTTGASSQD